MIKLENLTFRRPLFRLDTQEAIDVMVYLVEAAKNSNESIEIFANSYYDLTISCDVPFSLLDGPDDIRSQYINGLFSTDCGPDILLEDYEPLDIEEGGFGNHRMVEHGSCYQSCLFKSDQFQNIERKYLNMLSILRIDGLCSEINYSMERLNSNNDIIYEMILKLALGEKTREYVKYKGSLNYLNGKYRKS